MLRLPFAKHASSARGTDYYVYVIEALDHLGRPFYYVGQSAKTPEVRFAEHKRGADYCKGKCQRKNKQHVHGRVVRLRHDLFASYNPIASRAHAEVIERWLGKKLRARGYTVKGGH